MNTWSRPFAAAMLVAVVFTAPAYPAAGQSAPPTVRPGAPGQASRTVTPEAPDTLPHPQHTAADVHFMQGMIPHHAQALEMTALVPTRSDNRDLHLLAERIEVTQEDEIRWMQRWLQDRGEEAPSLDAHAHHHGAHPQTLMPGMLTREEMAQLANATGAEFDRLFLEFMIRHHEGALVMVAELFGTQGAAQEAEIYRFASDVEVDQRAEIRRMRAMLETPPAPGH